MSRARDVANLGSDTTNLEDISSAYNAGALSNRNLIINGAMQVAQRGTSFTANGYGLDRWKTFNSGGTATLSQQTFAAGEAPERHFTNYVRIVRASPSGTYFFSQKVEDVRLSDDATLTFSFYAKASAAVTISCRIPQEFGSGGSSGVNITAQNKDVTTSWQRFSMTFNTPSIAGKTIGAGSCFEPVFDIPATTATIEITGVQVEYGDTATPFEHRSYGQELALCQRYYWTSYDNVAAGTTGTNATSLYWVKDGTNSYATFGTTTFPSQMRVTPTCAIYNPTTGAAGSATSDGNDFTAQVYFARKHTMAGGHANVSIGNATGINYHMTADAEL